MTTCSGTLTTLNRHVTTSERAACARSKLKSTTRASTIASGETQGASRRGTIARAARRQAQSATFSRGALRHADLDAAAAAAKARAAAQTDVATLRRRTLAGGDLDGATSASTDVGTGAHGDGASVTDVARADRERDGTARAARGIARADRDRARVSCRRATGPHRHITAGASSAGICTCNYCITRA